MSKISLVLVLLSVYTSKAAYAVDHNKDEDLSLHQSLSRDSSPSKNVEQIDKIATTYKSNDMEKLIRGIAEKTKDLEEIKKSAKNKSEGELQKFGNYSRAKSKLLEKLQKKIERENEKSIEEQSNLKKAGVEIDKACDEKIEILEKERKADELRKRELEKKTIINQRILLKLFDNLGKLEDERRQLDEYIRIQQAIAQQKEEEGEAKELGKKEIEKGKILSQEKKRLQQEKNEKKSRHEHEYIETMENINITAARTAFKNYKDLISLIYEIPVPHEKIKFVQFENLLQCIKEFMNTNYKSTVSKKSKGSHYHPQIKTAVNIFGQLIEMGENKLQSTKKQTTETSFKATVVKSHHSGHNESKLSSDSVEAIRDLLLKPIGLTPQIFEE